VRRQKERYKRRELEAHTFLVLQKVGRMLLVMIRGTLNQELGARESGDCLFQPMPVLKRLGRKETALSISVLNVGDRLSVKGEKLF